ncbi:unnamed protein product [Periconia digitata]|uniref:Zn(2)-C6 fungal-type domain-containing protein n=1 Tax=Periconia digitata TaxID=1303443 RepID=A0A9W4U6B9_9PLEO|nr:unnamed protein product [Periconia digitata]
MHPGAGPYDGRRARRKRCKACSKRKIKCQGGVPCEHCRKTSQPCQSHLPESKPALVFVSQKAQATTLGDIQKVLVRSSEFESDLSYFTTCFLPMNLFSGHVLFQKSDLRAILRASPASEHAISAISSLHSVLAAQDKHAQIQTRGKFTKAMESYGQSVTSVQCLISNQKFQSESYTLWSTFLLGLFELMRDNTGENWLMHFLGGTCAMLRLQHPSGLTLQDEHSKQRRKFFFDTRIFEITRSLLFTEPTFLTEPAWTDALTTLWAGGALWHPKEALFDILPKFSDLGIRVLRFCHTSAEQMLPMQQFDCPASLALEGLSLRQSLEEWSEMAALWSATPHCISDHTETVEVDLLIGNLYFHAISIYLSGIFDYHAPWTMEGAPPAPILTRNEVEQHVAAIFRLSLKMLDVGVAGILLFFPLRVAGARSWQVHDHDMILSLFRQIRGRGYTTAETLMMELGGLWESYRAAGV